MIITEDTEQNAFPLSDLLMSLEGLYQVLLRLTVKAKEKEDDLDKQVAFEETRKAIIEEASQILSEANRALSKENAMLDVACDITFFEQNQEKLVSLIQQVLSMDQQRTAVFQVEKEALRQELHQATVRKQAVMTYQKIQSQNDSSNI